MKMAFWQHLIALTLLIGGTSLPAQAAQFEQQEIDQSRFIVLAAPGGDIGYKLLILEQLKDSRPCWSETGSNPSAVDPLLLSFDFTGICNRIVDSNGFSLRTAGEDQALQYSLRIIPQDNDLILVAASNTDRNVQIEVGRTNGIPTGFSRIVLNPGWRLTRRAYNGKAVGHIYLTYDQPIEVLANSAQQRSGRSYSAPSVPNPVAPPENGTPENGTPENGTPGIEGAHQGVDNVILVPSLPPAPASAPILDRPLPPVQPRTLPPVTPTEAAPSLSSILPPPPPSSIPAPRLDQSLPQSRSAASGSNSTSSSTATGGPTDEVETEAAENASTSNPSEARSDNTVASNSRNNSRRLDRPVTTSRVPTASNSGGAALRPRAARRSASTTASSTSSRSSASTSEPSNSESAPESASQTAAIAQAETYQVIVVADSAESQDKVKSIAPNAFLTTINGQVVMQVGLFRDRQAADRLQQRLSAEGLPTAVIPVR